MKKLFIATLAISFLLISACSKEDANQEDTNPTNQLEDPEGYTMVWSDEFDGTVINSAYWNYETGDGTDYGLPSGWGNNEKQIYTSDGDNSGIELEDGNSVLEITALEDNSGGYTSARLTTKNHVGIRFGRVDVKAKMPEGQGLWPAIWMLGDNIDEIDWPGCGEIDIAEVLGHQTSTLNTTLHYTNSEHQHGETQNIHELLSGSFSDAFHIYTLEWSPESLIFSLDEQQIFQAMIEGDMKEFLRSFYLVLNVAVGGNLPGDPDETTVFPQTMFVDYVRIYSKDDLQIPDPPVLNIEEETVGQFIEPNIGDNAIKDGFGDLGSLAVIVYGPGAPEISTSETAIDGDLSLVFDFPGENWGGAYLELETPKKLSSYTNLKFSLNMPISIVNAEIKLENPTANATVFLENYSGNVINEGFVEYTIPLADFTDLDLSEVSIPFAIWNPQDVNQNFATATLLIDNVYFSN